jgi:hypothetical protein
MGQQTFHGGPGPERKRTHLPPANTTKYIGIELSPAVYRRIRDWCVFARMSIPDLVHDAVREYLRPRGVQIAPRCDDRRGDIGAKDRNADRQSKRNLDARAKAEGAQ